MRTLVALVLIGCIASAIADCGVLQRLKVKQQWAQAFGQGTDREAFGTALWKNLFGRAPAARALFSNVEGSNIYSNKFQAHIQRVLGGLDMSISLLDDEGTLNAELAHLKSQHDQRGIAEENFEVFKASLLDVVPDELGRCFDKDAWSECFDVIASGIKG